MIGGTSESVELANAIAKLRIPCTVTVTTVAAETLYPKTPNFRVRVGCLDTTEIEEFLRQEKIVAILDASHPYAVEISRIAIAAGNSREIPYLRFERRAVKGESGAEVIYLDSFHSLVEGNYLNQQRVLLTVGYQALPLFQDWHDRAILFARILPSVKSLAGAIASGFTSDRIIALRPPVTAELEKALWRYWHISLVVTKASGVAGGEDVKRMVAAELGIPLVVINRPHLDYPQETGDLSVALEFCAIALMGSGE